MLEDFAALCREDGKTALIVSHDDAMLGVADRVLTMEAINRVITRHG